MLLVNLGEFLTSPFGLVHGVRPDLRKKIHLFSPVYYSVDRYSSVDRDHFDLQSIFDITIGWSDDCEGIILHFPHSKVIHHGVIDYKMDDSRSLPSAFNLSYDCGVFLGLYNGSLSSPGLDLYPPGTQVLYTNDAGC